MVGVVHRLKIETRRNAIQRQHLFKFMVRHDVEVGVKHVQRLTATVRTPIAKLRKNFQDTLDEMTPHPQILYVLILVAIPSPQDDKIVSQIHRAPR